MRNLVSIRTIKELRDIPGADRIHIAIIDGWQCIVKKEHGFKVGDNGFYFEIDSMLPTKDERFAFLAKGKVQDFARVKTIRLKGQLSQGLLLPMSMLSFDESEQLALSPEIKDFAPFFGVQKYEPAAPMGGKQKGTFPTHLVPKTDQERIQNIPEVLDGKRIVDFEVTEKLDGTSCTIWFHYQQGVVCHQDSEHLNFNRNPYIGVASRNWEMQKDDDNVYSQMLRKYDLVAKLAKLNRNIAIQGEIIGPSIQDNNYKLTQQEFFVFDIYDIDAKKYLGFDERMKLVFDLELNHVPIMIWNQDTPMTLDSVLALADGRSKINQVMREGLVFKALDGSHSFKAISNEWLLKNE